ncbi:MAG TPA: TIGR02757 family protein [Bacteroidia bacterium]|nr:TIGR02757 family protein [Bacteroidia bacterium]
MSELLEYYCHKYNSPEFIEADPISIPHRYTGNTDREISGFLAATFAWGQRAVIIKNGLRFMQLMDDNPYEFIMHASATEIKRVQGFVHRTFNGADAVYFIRGLRHIYTKYGGMEGLFAKELKSGKSMGEAISLFRGIFFEHKSPGRTAKHIADPLAGSTAKRINMFLRWMVRCDNAGVDFGIWKSIPASSLMCPLDVHSGRVARELGLLMSKQNNWKAVDELTGSLRIYDPLDPVKYDFALFGLGVNG